MNNTIIYGFAIFAMFFGSGNLVFPLEIGVGARASWLSATTGLMFTGVALPVLGLFVIKKYKGSYKDFFGQLDPFMSRALPLFLLALLGSFGVVPRCITVAYNGVITSIPFDLWLFSALFCFVTFYFCQNEKRLVSVIGRWLTPLLLGSLIMLIGAGIYQAGDIEPGLATVDAFQDGFLRGYQTMDLIAAFFFASLIYKRLQKELNLPAEQVHKHAIGPSLVGAGLLFAVYFGYVFLGAAFGELGSSAQILPGISSTLLGEWGNEAIAVLMVLSCLTTAVALSNLFARYLCDLFKLDYIKTLVVTLTITFFFSLYDFTTIAATLGPVLEVLYPGLISLTVLSLITPRARALKIVCFYGSIIGMLALNII